MSNREDQGEAGAEHHHVLPLVDATSGDWYGLGGGHAQRWGVYTGLLDGGGPIYDVRDGGHKGVGVFDPRCLRLHDLGQQLPNGARDRRISIQIVNDPAGGEGFPKPGAAPYVPEEWDAAQRSTREVDSAGRSALAFTQRVIVDAEDRHALALALGDLTLRTVSEVPQLGPIDDAGGGFPPGVAIAPDGSSVSVGGTGGSVTFRGPGAVDAARAAAAGGGSAGDVARAASNAARGLPPPPKSLWEGAGPEPGSGTRPRPPEPDTNARGSVASGRPARGYTTDGRKHGLLSTMLAPPSSISHAYFRGSEGTPIGPQGIRHDAHFTMAGLTGRVAFDSTDASTIAKGGGRVFKGVMRADTSRANVNTDVGGETAQWVPAVAVDAAIPPSTRPPPPSTVTGDTTVNRTSTVNNNVVVNRTVTNNTTNNTTIVVNPVAAGDGIGVVNRVGPNIGESSGQPTPPAKPATTRVETGATDLNALTPVDAPAAQGRDFTGPGVPCPNSVAGRVVTVGGADTATQSGDTTVRLEDAAAIARVPLVISTPSGALVDEHGFPGVTPLPGKRLAIGGRDPKADPKSPQKPERGAQLQAGAGGEQVDTNGVAGGVVPLGFSAPPGGRVGGIGFTPGEGGDRGVAPGAAERHEAAVRRAQAEAIRTAKIEAAKDGLRAQQEAARAAAAEAKERGDKKTERAATRAAERAARGLAEIQRREQQATDRRQRLENYKRAQAEAAQVRAQHRRESAAQERQRQREAVQRARDARERRDGKTPPKRAPAPATPAEPNGAWVINTEDPSEAQRIAEEIAARQLAMEQRLDAARDPKVAAFIAAEAALLGQRDASGVPVALPGFGEYTTANAPVPLLGSPEAPTVETHAHRVALAVEAQRQILMGLCGGPSYFGGNLGQRETNRPGRTVTGSSLGQNAVAYPGQRLEVSRTQPPLEVIGQLTAQPGATVVATGGGVLNVRRVHTGNGVVVDKRPLVLLDNDASNTGKVTADPISTPSRGFHVNAQEQAVATKVAGAPSTAGGDAVVGTARDPATGAIATNAPAAVLTEDGKVVTRLGDGSQWESVHEDDNTTTLRKRMPDGSLKGGARFTLGGGITRFDEDGTESGVARITCYPSGTTSDGTDPPEDFHWGPY